MGRKAAKLADEFTAQLVASGRTITTETEIAVTKAADYSAVAEAWRARLLRGEAVSMERVQFLDRLADRAVRALFADDTPIAKADVEPEVSLEDYLDQQQGDAA
jgi:hypothetical protein